MFRKFAFITVVALSAGAVLFVPGTAHAYIGPGAGFALVSSFVTLFIAFFTAFFALLTFPFRALVRSFKRRRSLKHSKVKKVIVLGLDGLDPEICDKLIAEGQLPNMKQLMKTGTFNRLLSSTPPISPVAWSTFATGVDTSRHNIYDFLSRDPMTYLPKLSSSEVYGGQKFLRLGPVRIPIGKGGGIRMLRKSKSFWKVLSEHGVFCSVLRVPITFPVEKVNGTMIAGMCVPDLRGSMGSFTYFTTSKAQAEKIGGLVIEATESGGWIKTAIPGPASPVDGKTLELPLSFRRTSDPDGVEIRVGKETHVVANKTYTPWIRLTFRAGPGVKPSGIVRFCPVSTGGELGLYMTPIHIDPEKPALPFSHPSFFSVYLAKLLGPYGTLGLAEDTWALNERILDEKTFIDQAYLLHGERKKMWFHSLDRLRDGLACCVFDISDRMQHMFFRYLDDDHPANRDKDTTEFKDAIYDMYRSMDELVGETMKYVDDKTALFVISDHGFKQFKRGVDINSWLLEQGLLAVKDGAGKGEYLSSVDWANTKAYTVGLDGICINRKGRERLGIVDGGAEFEKIKRTIVDGLEALDDNGTRAVRRVFDVKTYFDGPYRDGGPDLLIGFEQGYRTSWNCAKGTITGQVFTDNTKSWSGDHTLDPQIVPGILFSNLKIGEENPRLMDMAPTVLDLFGVEVPRYMVGKSLLGKEQ